MAPVVLFDLDGTLIDPAGGITGGIAHALRALGLPVPAQPILEAMVGPKLADALLARTAASRHQIPELIAIYRRWYAETGMTMGRVYPGITDVLDGLVDAGVRLGVATQKPQKLAQTILEAHGLAAYFDVIAGASDNEPLQPGQPGYRSGKSEIIAAALQALGDGPAVMIGDRAQDVDGATANGIPCLGAGWGFAEPDELANAGAAVVLDHARAVLFGLLEGHSWTFRTPSRGPVAGSGKRMIEDERPTAGGFAR
jgi:phosphoglycolate phosphatase